MRSVATILLVEDNRMDVELTLDALICRYKSEVQIFFVVLYPKRNIHFLIIHEN